MLRSYAQNFEDVILYRALKSVQKGFYIDIGAQEPVIDSVSLAFYELGWRGVHVEPNHEYAEKLRRTRPDEVVLELAVGARSGATQFFEVSNTGLSTADSEIAAANSARGFPSESREVKLLKSSELLEQYKDRDIHWLKIDVEGFEKEIIEGWLPSGVRPWIVVAEATKPGSAEPSHADWEPQLISLGYDFVYFDGLNRFYVSQAHPELKAYFGAGPNVFDNFCRVDAATACILQSLEQENQRLAQSLDAMQQTLDALRQTHQNNKIRVTFNSRLSQVEAAFKYIIRRLFFRTRGDPRYLVRRVLFHKKGTVRKYFKRIVFRSKGTIRDWFAESQWLQAAIAKNKREDSPARREPGSLGEAAPVMTEPVPASRGIPTVSEYQTLAAGPFLRIDRTQSAAGLFRAIRAAS